MKFYVEQQHETLERGLEEQAPETSVISISSKSMTPENPWDSAHALVQSDGSLTFAEPLMDYMEDIGLPEGYEDYEETTERGLPDAPPPVYDKDWSSPAPPSLWHLQTAFSQLADAVREVANSNPDAVIRVAHFDTGYDPDHSTLPVIRKELQKNFLEAGRRNDASDPDARSGIISNPGHGTGTLAILGGREGLLPTGDTVAIGAAPFVEVVPLRIANAVVLIKSDHFVEAMNYVLALSDNPATRIHVVTMSMGGVASKAWARVINEAYEKGILVVTAAGNNFGRKTPRTLVYPARFNRVIAACGITHDLRPYSKVWASHLTTMQGNYGPSKLMRTALSAFTPNMPWAQIGTGNQVHLKGAGTSSATPQIAAAAAIYWKKYYHELMELDGWQQTEVIRQALFQSATLRNVQSIEGKPLAEDKKRFYFGNGYLQAGNMLRLQPSALLGSLKKEEKDNAILPFWRVLLGTKALTDEENVEAEMYQLEILQLIQVSPRLQEILQNEEKTLEDLNEDELDAFIGEILRMKEASESLKEFLEMRR